MRRIGLAILAAVVMAAPARADTDARTAAAGMLAAMEGNASRVATMLRQARASKPVPAGRVKCIDDALSRVDAAVRAAKDDEAQVRAAVRLGDTTATKRALLSLRSKRQAAREATMTADACGAGVTATPAGATVVRVHVDQKLPPDSAVFKR
jgi:hypothetical protein